MRTFRSILRLGTVGHSQQGQILVIVGVALLALIAMVGLVLDGGLAWGHQRQTQNGADAVSKAGNVPILEWLGGDDTKQIGEVRCAVDLAAAEAEVTVEEVVFTNHLGEPIADPVPPCNTVGDMPPLAQGVKAVTTQEFDTFLMGILGFDQLTARADATAVVGPVTGFGVALPVTFPQTLELCDDTSDVYTIRDWDVENDPSGPAARTGLWDPYEILPVGEDPSPENLAIVPLCETGPGSVGWLDYGCGNIAESIEDPCDIFITIPGWVWTQTGNVNCCETELGIYHGTQPGVWEPDEDTLVNLPIHQVTCETDPGTSGTGVDRVLNPCATGPGQGNNLYYGVEFWVGFILDEAHVQGGDAECEEAEGTPELVNPGGQVGCLKGWFRHRIGLPGDVSIGDVNPGDIVDLGITLIN